MTLPWPTQGQLYLWERTIIIITAAALHHTQAFIGFKILRVLQSWFNVEFTPSFCFNRHSFLSKEAFREIRFLLCISSTKRVTIILYIAWSSTAFPFCSREGFCPSWAHLWAPELWFNSPGQTPHLLLLLLCPEWAMISNFALCCSFTPLAFSKCQGQRCPRGNSLRQLGWILSVSLSFPLIASQVWQVWPGNAESSSYQKSTWKITGKGNCYLAQPLRVWLHFSLAK